MTEGTAKRYVSADFDKRGTEARWKRRASRIGLDVA